MCLFGKSKNRLNDSLPYENLLGIPQPICNDNMRSFTVLETVVLRNAAVVGFILIDNTEEQREKEALNYGSGEALLP